MNCAFPEELPRVYTEVLRNFQFLAGNFSTSFSSAASPAHPSDAPSASRCAWTQSDSASRRNTTSPGGPRHQSASTAGCASILPTAESSFPDPAAEISLRKCERSKPEQADSTPPKNRSGTNPCAPASPSPG